MNQTVFRYNIYGIIIMLVLTAIHLFILMPPRISWMAAEVVGYLTMTLSMIFVFFGIKHFRDHVNNGSLTFGQGMKIGLLIALGPAVLFSLFDLLYVKVINPHWSDDYYGFQVKQLTSTTPPDQLPEKLKELNEQKEFFGQPAMLFIIMFITVFVIGTIVAIISSLTLRRKKLSVQ